VALTLLMAQVLMMRLLTIAFLIAACDGAADLGADAGTTETQDVGQGTEARGPLVVNELVASPDNGPDWIEVFNRSDADIDLCDYFLSDSLDRLDHYHHLAGAPPPEACAPTMLAVGGFLVIYADDNTAAGPDHAPFKLGEADEAHIISTRGEAIDSLIYLLPGLSKGTSLARQPSGEGLFWISQPSMGAHNPDEDGL
jgi:hypothetical protein